MNPNLTPKDRRDAMAFLKQMDVDLQETRDMIRTEENLIKAVTEYEQVWKVKIRLTHELARPHEQ